MSPLDLTTLLLGLAAAPLLLTRLRPLPSRTTERCEPGARVSIVVPARNEAGSLPRLLGSLAELTTRPWEVIVVDDGSTDGTADLARRLGAHVVSAPEPPEGWLGKPWACHVGAGEAAGTHLLFLDADTWLAPDALGRLVAAHDSGGGGVLSVQPHHVTERPYEQLSAYFNVVGLVGSSPADMAFGPCLLTSVDDYRRVGGHAAVRGEVIEDVRLAQLYRDERMPVRGFRGADTVRFRMYPDGLRQLLDGWTKNIAAGASTTRLAPLFGTVAWIAANILAPFRALTQPGLWTAAAWILVAAELWWSLRRAGRFRWWTAALFPVPLAVFLAVFTRSTIATLTHRPVTWRDRQVIPS